MNPSSRILRIALLLAAIAFSLQIIPRWSGDSLVTDEESYITNAYYYLDLGDVWDHCATAGPGAVSGLTLIGRNLKVRTEPQPFYLRPLRFLFLDNPGQILTITILSRSTTWFLGLVLGFCLYGLFRNRPWLEGTAAMILWAFEPTLLGYSGTAKTDFVTALLFFLSVLCLEKTLHSSHWALFLGAGTLGGFCTAARYNGLMLLPVIGTLLWLEGGFFAFNTAKLRRVGLQGLFYGLGFSLAALLCFLPGTFSLQGHPAPWTLYWHAIASYLQQAPDLSDMGCFFAGHFWDNGSYLKLPFEFLFKNTLPLLFLLCVGITAALARKMTLPTWLWVPPLVYTGSFYILVKSVTIRHLLPAYPFYILIAAKAWFWLWEKTRDSKIVWVRFFPVILLVWHALSALGSLPCQLAYANELMPPNEKPNELNYFDWDFGQDTKRLADLARRRGWKQVRFMAYQRTDPYFYGLSWKPWTLKDLVQPQPGAVYVIDAALFKQNPEYAALIDQHSSWVGRVTPSGNIGGTFLYYEVPGRLDPAYKDPSPQLNSFPYYPDGLPPYPVADPSKP